MFDYLADEGFITWAIKRSKITFIVHGSLTCETPVTFPWDISIGPPTTQVMVKGVDRISKTEVSLDKVYFHELVNETVFYGEIALRDATRDGVVEALGLLERWADLLCLAHGNPKIQLEIQIPIRVITETGRPIEDRHIDRWHRLIPLMHVLPDEIRSRVDRGLWWYRKGCNAQRTSLFDAYAAFWNVLEILCGVSGSRHQKGPDVDEKIRKYLGSQKSIRAGHIVHCYNSLVNYGIPAQVKGALTEILGDEERATKWSFYCFDAKPKDVSFYKIRNDINHGNIRENNLTEARRVFLRGMLLQHLVYVCLHEIMGIHISPSENVDELVRNVVSTPGNDFEAPIFL